MRHNLDHFHNILGNCRAVAEFLGYTLRGYMKIRRKVADGIPLSPRVEAHLLFKASQLVSEPANTLTEGVASVTDHINSKNISGCQKEFNKALKRIKSLFQAGKTRKEIHAKLTEAGRITMCYGSFCNLVNKENAREPFIPAADIGLGKTDSSSGAGRKGRPAKRPSTQ
ncbi:hypothetical protein C4J81_06410 [Deltaproteobacteria bacterium Smac51]|nr:hypothetical protein C4J81_06410 [Deltaproteobacteria bacterium Smac51]